MTCNSRSNAAERLLTIETAEDMETQMRQLAQERGIPYETILAQNPLEDQVVYAYIEHYQKKILAHYEPQYTVVVA